MGQVLCVIRELQLMWDRRVPRPFLAINCPVVLSGSVPPGFGAAASTALGVGSENRRG